MYKHTHQNQNYYSYIIQTNCIYYTPHIYKYTLGIHTLTSLRTYAHTIIIYAYTVNSPFFLVYIHSLTQNYIVYII